ncbi:sugar phosphate isomerase/epimerase family protein [Marinoscillum furvescens]|nr:TIM barrel protein [Marinoscillum furvescens]
MKNVWLIISLLAGMVACDAPEVGGITTSWPISSYNFGGMQGMPVQEQVALLRSSGYDGLILRVATPENFEELPQFLDETDQHADFTVHAAFVRYNFEESLRRERWIEVVDQIAHRNMQLWVIFGKKEAGYDDEFIEEKLREINDYALARGVEVILYPHSSTYYESVEEAAPMVQKIGSSNLKTALHLYHEVRAGNGHRIHEVIRGTLGLLGAVTLAGTDSVADYSSPLARDTSTIKPIGLGTFDVRAFLDTLQQYDYEGVLGVMNFSIKASPAEYLPHSRKLIKSYTSSDK